MDEAATEMAMSSTDPGIVDIAVSTDDVSTLVAALQAADLVGALQEDGPFTMFAPVNGAFAGLAEGTLESLLQPENVDQLRDVLLYHVVPGTYVAEDLVGMTSIDALNGKELQITPREDVLMINDAPVVTADISASNGVVHLIDGVLMEW